jgi:hypothetical protein
MYERPPAIPPRRTLLLVLITLLFVVVICAIGYALLAGFVSSDWATGST